MAVVGTVRPQLAPSGWDELQPLIERRIAGGWSQGLMARAMNLSRETVGRYERGEVSAVSAQWRGAYAEALDALEGAHDVR